MSSRRQSVGFGRIVGPLSVDKLLDCRDSVGTLSGFSVGLIEPGAGLSYRTALLRIAYFSIYALAATGYGVRKCTEYGRPSCSAEKCFHVSTHVYMCRHCIR